MFWVQKDKDNADIDITDTWFEYDITVCNEYFELVECIIDKDPNKNWNQKMRLDLKNQIKSTQEGWRNLTKDELIRRCTDELEIFENNLKEKNVNSFGCLHKN